MGSEQSQPAGASQSANTTPRFQRPVSTDARLQRGYTIAAPTSDSLNNSQLVDTSPPPLDSRPVSPPMSVCSDSDLPYISYTDKPIGGEIKTLDLMNVATRSKLSLFRLAKIAEQRPESQQGATSCESPTAIDFGWCNKENAVISGNSGCCQ